MVTSNRSMNLTSAAGTTDFVLLQDKHTQIPRISRYLQCISVSQLAIMCVHDDYIRQTVYLHRDTGRSCTGRVGEVMGEVRVRG